MNKLIYILIFFTLTFPLSAQTKIKDRLLFEISDVYSNNMKSSSTTYYFYQSRRIDCQKYKQDFQKKNVSKKVKCFQTSPAKIAELVKLAEATDFQSVKESYTFFSGGYDWGKTFYISYLNESGKKNIDLTHSRFGDDGLEPIPDALKLFLQKIGEIDKTMKIEN